MVAVQNATMFISNSILSLGLTDYVISTSFFLFPRQSSILPCFSYTSGPPPVSLPLLAFPFLTPLWSSVFWSSLDSGIRLCFSVPRLFDFLFFLRRTAGFEEPRKESMQDNSPMIGKTLLTYVVSPLTYSTAV